MRSVYGSAVGTGRPCTGRNLRGKEGTGKADSRTIANDRDVLPELSFGGIQAEGVDRYTQTVVMLLNESKSRL